MKVRVLVFLAAVAVLQATGCGRLCPCCGGSGDSRSRDARKDELPPPDVLKNEGPPPAIPTNAGNPNLTGAYGGSGGR